MQHVEFFSDVVMFSNMVIQQIVISMPSTDSTFRDNRVLTIRIRGFRDYRKFSELEFFESFSAIAYVDRNRDAGYQSCAVAACSHGLPQLIHAQSGKFVRDEFELMLYQFGKKSSRFGQVIIVRGVQLSMYKERTAAA